MHDATSALQVQSLRCYRSRYEDVTLQRKARQALTKRAEPYLRGDAPDATHLSPISGQQYRGR
jgi:hypothetical protein